MCLLPALFGCVKGFAALVGGLKELPVADVVPVERVELLEKLRRNGRLALGVNDVFGFSGRKEIETRLFGGVPDLNGLTPGSPDLGNGIGGDILESHDHRPLVGALGKSAETGKEIEVDVADSGQVKTILTVTNFRDFVIEDGDL